MITEEDISTSFRPDSVEKRITKWQETLQNDPTKKTFVAKVEGKIAGYVAITNATEEKTIGAMYVHPTQQGKGIGKALMNKALDTLGRNNRIVLNVAGHNENAIAFYKSFGFEITRDIQEPVRKLASGVEIPEVEMIRNPD